MKSNKKDWKEVYPLCSVYHFATEKEMDDFDKLYNYSGSLKPSDDTYIEIYNEGTSKWFSIQFLQNEIWIHRHFVDGRNIKLYKIKPQSYNELIYDVEKIVNNLVD